MQRTSHNGTKVQAGLFFANIDVMHCTQAVLQNCAARSY